MKVAIIKLPKEEDLLEKCSRLGFRKCCVYLDHDGIRHIAKADPYFWDLGRRKNCVALGDGDGLIVVDGVEIVGEVIVLADHR